MSYRYTCMTVLFRLTMHIKWRVDQRPLWPSHGYRWPSNGIARPSIIVGLWPILCRRPCVYTSTVCNIVIAKPPQRHYRERETDTVRPSLCSDAVVLTVVIVACCSGIQWCIFCSLWINNRTLSPSRSGLSSRHASYT